MRLAGLTIICISDTHGQHRSLKMPPDDILIHAGLRCHALDFIAGLGDLPYKHIVVVQGNHESNAAWKHDADTILSNAILLRNSFADVGGVRVFGTDFFRPCPSGNAYLL